MRTALLAGIRETTLDGVITVVSRHIPEDVSVQMLVFACQLLLDNRD